MKRLAADRLTRIRLGSPPGYPQEGVLSRVVPSVQTLFRLVSMTLAVALFNVPARAQDLLPTERVLQTRDREVRSAFLTGMEQYAAADYQSAEAGFAELTGWEGASERDREIFDFMVGRCRYARHDYSSCQQYYRDFLSRHPRSDYRAAAWVLIGHCRFSEQDSYGAALAYLQALAQGPERHQRIAADNLEPLVRRGLPLLQLENLAATLADDRWASQVRLWIAQRWEGIGRWDEAARYYRQVERGETRGDHAETARARLRALQDDDPGPLRVGVLVPLSGSYAEYGRRVERAAHLAAQQQAGRIELIVRDSQEDPLVAARQTESLIDAGCAAVIGPLIPECIPATVALLSAQQVVQVLPIARYGIEHLTALSPHLYVWSTPVSRQAKQLLAAAAADGALHTLAVLAADTPEGHEVAAAVTANDEIAGLSILPVQFFSPGQTDLPLLVRRLTRTVATRIPIQANEVSGSVEGAADGSLASLDGLIIWGMDPEELTGAVAALREAQFSGLFLGDHRWGEVAAADSGAVLPDSALYVSDQWVDIESSEGNGFIRRFREAFRSDPDWLAARTFDAVNWLNAGADAPRIQPLDDHLREIPTPTAVGGSPRDLAASGAAAFGAQRFRETVRVFRIVAGRPHLVAGDGAREER